MEGDKSWSNYDDDGAVSTVAGGLVELEEDYFFDNAIAVGKRRPPAVRSFSKGILTESKNALRNQRLKRLLFFVAGLILIAELILIGRKTAKVLRDVSSRQQATDEEKRHLETAIILNEALIKRASEIEEQIQQQREQIAEIKATPKLQTEKVKKLTFKPAWLGFAKKKSTKYAPDSFSPGFASGSTHDPEVREVKPPLLDADASASEATSSRASDTAFTSSIGGINDPFRHVLTTINEQMKLVREEEDIWQQRRRDAHGRLKDLIISRRPEQGPHEKIWKLTEEIQVPGTHPEAKEWLEASGKKATQAFKAIRRDYVDPTMTLLLEEADRRVWKEIQQRQQSVFELSGAEKLDDNTIP
ncbi:hypothetical protein BESB_034630 [Besnoitia besnoiti]|uniref:Transmembrane protein n=1 Tax=Besnoitia besnoiti TaxID=94643 RepID=A0A2A9MG91_BESBE|nr:hypothetical protein BESB_034630 [Besnoitia besnoiti]PFH37005.1 hypothetical protein BESB_034630 [Besnoitia besnoiti]